MASIYIPNHLYPTPSASGKITCYVSFTPLHSQRQTFTFIHSIAELQEIAITFYQLSLSLLQSDFSQPHYLPFIILKVFRITLQKFYFCSLLLNLYEQYQPFIFMVLLLPALMSSPKTKIVHI